MGHPRVFENLPKGEKGFLLGGNKERYKKMVKQCEVCQTTKHDNLPPAGLLQSLPLRQQAWDDITLDFIDGLPISHGFNVILVVVDRFTKYGHFQALSHPYTTQKVDQIFFDEIY